MSNVRDIVLGEESRKGLKAGVDMLANAVKISLGAKGRFAVFRGKDGKVRATKDGVSIAKEVTSGDPIEQLGIDMVRQAAEEAADGSEDGTTTATVIAQAMVAEGHRMISMGANPIDLKRGIDKAVVEVVKYIKEFAVPVEEGTNFLLNIATLSANGDAEIGKLVSDAYARVGSKGIVTAEVHNNPNTIVEVVEGVRVERGFISAYFITDPARKEAVLESPMVLLYDDKISSFKELIPALTIVGESGREVLIMANEVDPEVVSTIAANKMQGRLKVSVIKTPNFGELNREILDDIAMATSARVISKKAGGSLEKITPEDFGQCEKVISNYNETVIIGGHHSEEVMEKYLVGLGEIEGDPYSAERIARLMGGVAVILVGGATELEAGEVKDRVDDAIGAVRSAAMEGVVTGGGSTLVQASNCLDCVKVDNKGEEMGVDIVRRAIRVPLQTIVNNSGGSGEVALHLALKNTIYREGFDVRVGEMVDMFDAGIIDPAKVTRIAIQSAASVAGVILTTECVIGSY